MCPISPAMITFAPTTPKTNVKAAIGQLDAIRGAVRGAGERISAAVDNVHGIRAALDATRELRGHVDVTVETVRVLPTVRHPVEVRIVVERIDQHAVGVASRVEAGEHGLVAVHVHHGEFGDEPGYASMSGVHAERTRVVTVEHPCTERGT